MKELLGRPNQPRVAAMDRRAFYEPGEGEPALQLDVLASRFRRLEPGRISVAVADPTSHHSFSILEGCIEAGLVTEGDSVTLIETPHSLDSGRSLAFGEYFLPSRRAPRTRIVSWLNRVQARHLITRTYDLVILPVEAPEEVDIFHAITRRANLTLVRQARAEEAVSTKLWTRIAATVPKGERRPVFSMNPLSQHCIPLAAGNEKNARTFLKLAAACDEHRKGACSSLECPAGFVQGIEDFPKP